MWNASGQLLVKSDIKDFSDVDVSDLDASGFIWAPITYTTLSPGQYFVGAYVSQGFIANYGSDLVLSNALAISSYSLYGSEFGLASGSGNLSDLYPKGLFGPNIRFAEKKNISINGSFKFDSPMLNSELYTVTVSSQPAGVTCVLTNGSGKLNSANVTNVTVACTQNSAS